MDQSPEVIFNTIFLGGAILWTVLSSAVIYLQYSTSASESGAVRPKPRPSQIETEKKSAGIELKFTFGKEPQRKSKYICRPCLVRAQGKGNKIRLVSKIYFISFISFY